MKKLLLFALLIPLASVAAYGQITVQCGPPKFKDPSIQYRGDVKHRSPGDSTGTSIKVVDVYNATIFPAVTVAQAAAAAHQPMAGSKEAQAFTLDAFLWQAKVESNDCEVHLELNDSQTDSTAQRMIVEIPPDPAFSSDYQAILRLISQKFPKTRVFGPDVPFRFPKPIHMQITGFGFFDGVHEGFAGTEGGNGGHGSASVHTFWELHPAWHVVILNP